MEIGKRGGRNRVSMVIWVLVALFVSELEKAETLYVRIRSINGGRTSVEYPVKGAWGAVRAAFASCAMPAPPLSDAGRARLPGIY